MKDNYFRTAPVCTGEVLQALLAEFAHDEVLDTADLLAPHQDCSVYRIANAAHSNHPGRRHKDLVA